MKAEVCKCVLAGLIFASSSLADIEFVPQSQAEAVFPGPARRICVTIRNQGPEVFQGELQFALNQLGSAVAAPIARGAWKKVHVLPEQTVIECGAVSFPEVRSPTRCLLQWMNGQRVLGRTDVVVYPTDLLSELRAVVSSNTVGVIDPRGVIKRILTQQKIGFEDVERLELEQFTGGLVIAGPFTGAEQMPPRLGLRLSKLADRGVAAIWIQPPRRAPEPGPSWYSVRERERPIVIAQDNTVSGLADNPLAQLTLIEMVKVAFGGKFQLPGRND